jgi:hypothetical protein
MQDSIVSEKQNILEEIMADFVDFITSMKFESSQNVNHPGNKFLEVFKSTTNADDLLKWFHTQKHPVKNEFFNGVSKEDCEKLLANKNELIAYGDVIKSDDGY